MTVAPNASRYVYFIRLVDQRGPVKIGVSKTPEARLRQIQESCPFPLEIAAAMPGAFGLERRFHAYFLADHSHHEWFRSSARIGAVIEDIRASRFDVSVLPDGKLGIVLPAKPPARPFDSRIRSIVSRLRHAQRRNGAPIGGELEADYEALKAGSHPDPLAGVTRLGRFIEQAREGSAAA
jgi:hypothetical protein